MKLFLIVFVMSISNLYAQKISINGYVQDKKSGEKLVNVNVYSPISKKNMSTNNFGYFTLTLPVDTVGLVFTMVGYEAIYKFFDQQNSDTTVIIELEKTTKDLESVTVLGRRKLPIEQRTNMGQINVPIEIIKSLPKFLGESDVLKTIQLLPGVQQGIEGTSGILVRGGGPDQNLILLDGSPLYNTQHLFGIFSTFNTDAIKNVEFYKGGFPARFGGRISSVVDVVTKDGHMKEFHGVIGTGLIMSKATLEGPIVKDKTSFLISGRRSYIDILAQPFIKKAAKDEGIDIGLAAYLYDINAKINHIFSKKDRLYFSVFSSQDFLKLKQADSDVNLKSERRIRFGYGNILSTLRWNHVFNKKLFVNTILGFTKFRFVTELDIKEKDNSGISTIFVKYFSGIEDLSATVNFDYKPNVEHNIKFGTYFTRHGFKPGVSSVKLADQFQASIDTTLNPNIQNSIEAAVYFEDDWEMNEKLKFNLGVHSNFFQSENKVYASIQPRLSARYLLPKSWALKVGYSHMSQPLHLLTNSTTTLPIDLWVPSTDKIRPMKSIQYAFGIAKTIWNKKYEFSAEAYYKTMDGVIEYTDGASYLNTVNAAWDNKVEQGTGWSRGVELLLNKVVGKTKGWIAYTLSKSDRQFTTINYGNKFPYKYDRRHDFEIVVTHKVRKNLEISGTWGYSTAPALSLPTANYAPASLNSPFDNSFSNSLRSVDYFNGRNGFRMLNAHRLDGSINWIKKKKNILEHGT